MAKQVINRGTTAGDKTGESLYSAFGKVNENFTELYGAMVTLVANIAALPATGEAAKVYVTTDTGRLYRWGGSAYVNIGGLTFDANGNVDANVNLRTGTLANLLLLEGGVSEVGRASDVEALVLFNGVADGAVPFFRNRVVASAISGITATAANVSSTVWTPVPFNLTGQHLANENIINPANPTELFFPSGANAVRIHGHIQFSESAAGESRKLRVEYWNGSVWYGTATPIVNFGNASALPSALSGTGAQPQYAVLDVVFKNTTNATKMRLAYASDDGAGVTVNTANNNQLQIDMLAL